MVDPITPPPELVRHWSRFQGDTDPEALWFRIANEAAQWGADTELKACCEWADETGWQGAGDGLRTTRRPKAPSLKEQAMAALTQYMTGKTILTKDSVEIIRRALEALDD
jgi:hypothetical protein